MVLPSGSPPPRSLRAEKPTVRPRRRERDRRQNRCASDSAKISQHIEMQRRGLDGLGATFAQAAEVSFGGRQLGIAQQGFLREKLSGLVDVAGHEHAKAIRSESVVCLWNAESSSEPSGENWKRCLIFLVASSLKFLSIMSPICSRLMAKEMISIARCPSRSSRLPASI